MDARIWMITAYIYLFFSRSAPVVQFVCIILAIMQTVATVLFKLTATETDSFRQQREFSSINDNDKGKSWKTKLKLKI